MLKQKHEAIQASVALALIWSMAILAVIAFAGACLVQDWPRALNAIKAGVIILPICYLLRQRLRRGKSRQVLFVATLLLWLISSYLVFHAGTIINPNTAVLLCLSVTGVLANDRLLGWLLPSLCLLSVCVVYLLADAGLLTQNLPPSEIAQLVGYVMSFGYFVVLARLSNKNLLSALHSDEEKTQQLEMALNAGSLKCFTLQADTGWVEVNGDVSLLLDCPVGVLPLRSLSVFSSADIERMVQAYQEHSPTGHLPSLDVQLLSGTGSGKWFRLFATPSLGSSQRLICALQDIDEQKQADLAKENFTAMVSHELRTPLTALVGSLGLLQGLHVQRMSKEAQELLRLAIRGGERLSSLVNDILEFFKLQSGGLPVACTLQPIKPMVEHALDSVQALLQMRDLSVRAAGLDADVSALLDSSRAEQVLINVLANAIRFSPLGSLLWLEVSQTETHVRLDVRDAGPGIEPSFHGQIFKPFAQANAGNTRDNNSTGLGLSISRGLMRQMGGELSFSSPPGQGATFHIDFVRQVALGPS